jgi:hypothetical protein
LLSNHFKKIIIKKINRKIEAIINEIKTLNALKISKTVNENNENNSNNVLADEEDAKYLLSLQEKVSLLIINLLI